MLQTWEPTSIEFTCSPLRVFQNRIVLSAVPPPDANNPYWWGDHASALTAAECLESVLIGWFDERFHKNTLLSLPPEASCWPSNDHFSPHTYCLWAISLSVKRLGSLVSRLRIILSFEPELKMWLLFQDIDPTLAVCPVRHLIILDLFASQSWTVPVLVPTAIWFDDGDHTNDVTVSLDDTSHSLLTREERACHRYTELLRATAKTLPIDQSIRFK
jgi:hypothetical protein